jgi:M6 family metalloprotease-like protein
MRSRIAHCVILPLLCLFLTRLESFAEDLREYRTTATAFTAALRPMTNTAPQAAYLGVGLTNGARRSVIVTDVAAGSPAAAAGLKAGDRLLRLNRDEVPSAEEAREWLHRQTPGTTVTMAVERGRKALTLTATLAATSRPLKLAARRGMMGTSFSTMDDGDGIRLTGVTTNLPAHRAGLRAGDVLLKLDDTPLTTAASFTDALAAREAGETVQVTFRRGDEEKTVPVKLAASTNTGNTAPVRRTWKSETYRLAVVRVEFADVKHNPAIPDTEWNEFFFSRDVYRDKTNATGQAVYGSVNDYYREISCGRFQFAGTVFDWVPLKKKRAEYSQGTASSRSRSEFFTEALDALRERHGAEALKGFDGLAVIYAGERLTNANRGTLFWPHRSNTTYKGRQWPYVICAEGGRRMGNISVFCHEFGHILGLPDLYARPENPGSEGVGSWCAMSNQAGNGRPQHFSAWCKEQLGWLTPVVIDPSVKQKLVLGPVNGSTNECFKVLVRPDGSEYFLLENRRRTGFDRSLAAEGLLIWRVVAGRVFLHESHGITDSIGPRVFLTSVPYPSAANDSFTPFTTPNSRSELGGGLPVYITHIRQLPDGRITFHVGYEYQ